jgi:hypothetical protein
MTLIRANSIVFRSHGLYLLAIFSFADDTRLSSAAFQKLMNLDESLNHSVS